MFNKGIPIETISWAADVAATEIVKEVLLTQKCPAKSLLKRTLRSDITRPVYRDCNVAWHLECKIRKLEKKLANIDILLQRNATGSKLNKNQMAQWERAKKSRPNVEANIAATVAELAKQELSANLKDAIYRANEIDSVSPTSMSKNSPRAESKSFEETICTWFESHGVRLLRQDDLVSIQQTTMGRPITTPDILFLDHVTINGTPIAWIDAKCKYGANLEDNVNLMTGTDAQCSRYRRVWGSGAIVFRHGYNDSLAADGIKLLQASWSSRQSGPERLHQATPKLVSNVN